MLQKAILPAIKPLPTLWGQSESEKYTYPGMAEFAEMSCSFDDPVAADLGSRSQSTDVKQRKSGQQPSQHVVVIGVVVAVAVVDVVIVVVVVILLLIIIFASILTFFLIIVITIMRTTTTTTIRIIIITIRITIVITIDHHHHHHHHHKDHHCHDGDSNSFDFQLVTGGLVSTAYKGILPLLLLLIL